MIVSWLAVAAWAAVIFWFSSQAAQESDGLSIGVTQALVDILANVFPDVGDMNLGVANHTVRKLGHFGVYLILGFLVCNGVWAASRKNSARGFLKAWALCIVYAGLDELHQYFVPGRGAQFSDVLLDSLGALIGIVILILLVRIQYCRQSRISR